MKPALSIFASFVLLFNTSNIKAQNAKHEIFGLDMNLNWYDLTNYSAITYYIEDQDSSSKWVVTNFNYYLNKVEIELEEFNFNENLIVFNKGSEATKAALMNLSPWMYLGRYHYQDRKQYAEKAFKDAEFLKNKLTKVYGKPELQIETLQLRIYQWFVNDVKIIINSEKQIQETYLLYQIADGKNSLSIDVK